VDLEYGVSFPVVEGNPEVLPGLAFEQIGIPLSPLDQTRDRDQSPGVEAEPLALGPGSSEAEEPEGHGRQSDQDEFL
jgi:hypothetical protein